MISNNSPQRPPSYEDGQDIRDRSFEYACDVVGFCEVLDEGKRVGRLMVPQLLACSLSFPAMLEEARAAESDKDFISKCSIGLKECRESWTRLRVCVKCRLVGRISPINAATSLGGTACSIEPANRACSGDSSIGRAAA